jgi:hypothetical protein
MFFHPLDYADMGQAERASTLERQANGRPFGGRRILRQTLRGKSD